MTQIEQPGLDSKVAKLLANLCGLFGSHHDGEVATAARKVHQIVRSHGLVWGDIIMSSSSVEDLVDEALRHGNGIINAWEEGFLRGIRGRQHLTRKQLTRRGGRAMTVRNDIEAAQVRAAELLCLWQTRRALAYRLRLACLKIETSGLDPAEQEMLAADIADFGTAVAEAMAERPSVTKMRDAA